MNRDELVSAIKDLATRTNASVGKANWYLFGSAQGGLSNASDIDLAWISTEPSPPNGGQVKRF